MKITAKYEPKSGWVDEDNPSMIYKVRELHESNTGKTEVSQPLNLNDTVKGVICQ